MKKSIHVWIVLALWIVVTNGISWAENSIPQPGDKMPAIRLPAPKAADHQQYLGINPDSQFSLTDIKGELLIIQIFNMY